MAWQEEYKKMLKAKGIIEKDDIFTASFYGEISKLKDFIASGEYTTEDYTSALSLACERGNTEVVKLLLEVGANIKSIYDLGEHNVYMASKYGYIDIVKLLIENGAVFSGELGGNSPLSVASQVGHIDLVKLLVESGAKDLESALISAVSNNISLDKHLEIVKYLIDNGANNLNDALINSALYGHIEIVKYLIVKGATSFNDALINSAFQGHLEIVKLLIKNGATDLNKSLIASVEHPDVLQYLLEKGANPNINTKAPDYIKFGLSRPFVYGCNIDFIDISLLELAVSNNQLESVRHIIASSQNILGYDNALYIAVKKII